MPGQSHNPRIIYSVTNCIRYDQRVRKMASVAESMGYDVMIVGRRYGDHEPGAGLPFKTIRFRMLFKRTFLFYAFFNARLFFLLLVNRADLLVANDLDTLLPNYLVSRLKGIKLVYDSHEYFTGLPELSNRRLVKSVWRTIERSVFPKLENVITVSEPIAELYFNEYGIRPAVVRNCSLNASGINPVNRVEAGFSDEDFIIVLQGGGINIDKGAEELVTAVSQAENLRLIIAGSGDVLTSLKEMVNELGAGEKVLFLPSMEWQQLMRYTKMADAGMCLEKDTNLNYRFSLPNKLFDYIAAGIPVIAGNLPEIQKLVVRYNCGLIISSITVEEISAAIEKLRNDRELRNALALNAVQASLEINWNIESEKVTELYKKLKPENL